MYFSRCKQAICMLLLMTSDEALVTCLASLASWRGERGETSDARASDEASEGASVVYEARRGNGATRRGGMLTRLASPRSPRDHL